MPVRYTRSELRECCQKIGCTYRKLRNLMLFLDAIKPLVRGNGFWNMSVVRRGYDLERFGCVVEQVDWRLKGDTPIPFVSKPMRLDLLDLPIK